MRYFLLAAGLTLALAVPARAVVIYDSKGFENFANGNIVGQNGWVQGPEYVPTAQWPQNPANIVTGPGGSGKAIEFSNIQKTQTNIQVLFGQNLVGKYRYAVDSFDSYRVDSAIYNNIDWWPTGNNPYYGTLWDNGAKEPAQILPFGDYNKGHVVQTPNVWHHIVQIWDLQNGTQTAIVDGIVVGTNVDVGKGEEFNGFYFDDWQTVDQTRTPGAVGRKAYIDNLLVTATNDINSIPEPSSVALLGTGLLPLLGLRRRKTA